MHGTSTSDSGRGPSPGRAALLVLAVFASAFAAGCKVVDTTVSLPTRAVSAMGGSRQPSKTPPGELQTRLLRYADDFGARTMDGIDAYARRMGTEEARVESLRWKLAAISAALGIASGDSPYVALLDLVTMTSLTRKMLEARVGRADGEAFRPWLEEQRALDTNIWSIATPVLGPEQEQELRTAIAVWAAANPELRASFFVRPLENLQGLALIGESARRPTSVFGFIGLDPVADLDPAVREVTRSRLFAERAMFVVQRMPFLLRWQTEVLVSDFAARPQVGRVLTNLAEVSGGVERLGRAAESASRAAVEFPDRLAAEREAILAALENQQGRLKALAAELTTTLGAGDRMSTSLNTTLVTFDALMKRFGVGEPRDDRPRDTNAPPFRILDYAETADHLTTAARELDTLIRDLGTTLDSPALDRRTRELATAVQRAQADTRALLNHAARLAAGLVLLVFACALAWRRLTRVQPPPAGPATHRDPETGDRP